MSAPNLRAAASVLLGVLLMMSSMTVGAHPPAQATRAGAGAQWTGPS
jgi:hypothetical protein